MSALTSALVADAPPGLARQGLAPHVASLLASPAVITQPGASDGAEVLFAGTVTGRGGRPLGGATLQLWGIRLAADHRGGFEILAHRHHHGPPHIQVTVTASGYHPLRTEVTFATSTLADGTLVVLRDFSMRPVVEYRARGAR